MPPGAKKRKALKKKQQQEAIGTSNNGDNLHGGGNDEHGGSQDDRESDSNLSSPGSQGNEQFADVVKKDTAKEISEVTQRLGPNSGNGSVVERGIDDKKTIVEKSGNVIAVENTTQTARNVAPLAQDPCVKEIAAPVADSEVVVSEKSEHAETSPPSNLVKHKSGEDKEYPSTGLEKENGKVESAAGTSRKLESESQVQLSSDEKRLLLPDRSAVRTSWLSCCGLFDAMTGSDR